MAFCMQCGKELDCDSRFCSNCGLPVSSYENNNTFNLPLDERKTKFEWNHNCPQCGSLVKTFRAFCEFCGYEFRNSNNSSMIKEFERKYQTLKSNSQRTVLVQSLAVPNTKEDLLEMFYLSAASIAKSDKAGKKLDEAWQVKYEQSYMKVGTVLCDDPERERVERIYQEKKEELKRWRRRLFLEEWGHFILLGVTIVIFILLMCLLAVVLGVEN